MSDTTEIKTFAKKNSVPVIKDPSLQFIVKFIKENNVKKILEIGSAIGYSAINFASAAENVFVDTIEYDIERYKIAVKNILQSGLMDRITIFLGDAASFEFSDKYDLIFIDGPKAQNMKFFVKFQKNLAEGGAIITDNLAFHGMVENQGLTHNYSTIKMVRKIARYVTFLKENPEFETEFYEIGDTISVSRKNPTPNFQKYLQESEIIDFSSAEIQKVCKNFEEFSSDEILLVKKVFEFVEKIPNSAVFKKSELSLSASDVLKNGHGLCFAKSHLFAAILRNFGVPTGFCYQILAGKTVSQTGKAHFFPHGFNSVFLKSEKKWIKLDASSSNFQKNEQNFVENFLKNPKIDNFLLYNIDFSKYEVELPLIFTVPFKGLTDCMKSCENVKEFSKHLNDLSESMRAYYQW